MRPDTGESVGNTDDFQTICMPRREFEELLERAAERGAQEALQRIGLGDEHAGRDLGQLRSLLDAYRLTKRTALQTLARRIVDFILIAIVIAAGGKYTGIFH